MTDDTPPATPTPLSVPMERARATLPGLVHDVLADRVHITLTRHGRDAAVLVPLPWYDQAAAVVDHRHRNLKALEDRLAQAIAEDDKDAAAHMLAAALTSFAIELDDAELPRLAGALRAAAALGIHALRGPDT